MCVCVCVCCQQTLLNRVVVRLRALVILPNRDLALQVKSVFDLLCEGTDLKVSRPSPSAQQVHRSQTNFPCTARAACRCACAVVCGGVCGGVCVVV